MKASNKINQSIDPEEDYNDYDDQEAWQAEYYEDDYWSPENDRGGTGHGDDSYSDADPGL